MLGEVEFEVAGDVVNDGAGLGDLGVAGGAHGLEAHAFESSDSVFDAQAVLHGEGERSAERLAESRESGAFFGDFEEDLARGAVGIEPDGEVSLVAVDGELVGQRVSGARQSPSAGDHGGVLWSSLVCHAGALYPVDGCHWLSGNGVGWGHKRWFRGTSGG